jgi:hypothetical protein
MSSSGVYWLSLRGILASFPLVRILAIPWWHLKNFEGGLDEHSQSPIYPKELQWIDILYKALETTESEMSVISELDGLEALEMLEIPDALKKSSLTATGQEQLVKNIQEISYKPTDAFEYKRFKVLGKHLSPDF